MLQSHHGRILITGWCGQGLFLGVTVRRSTPWWEGWILRKEESHRGGGRWRGGVVENYTTSINHFYTTVFLSPSFSRFSHLPHALSLFLSFMAVHLPLLICTPTAPHPDRPPWLSALYSSFSPWPCALFEVLLVTRTTLLSIHLNFISTVVCLHAFFIDLLFVAYQGFIPLSMELY